MRTSVERYFVLLLFVLLAACSSLNSDGTWVAAYEWHDSTHWNARGAISIDGSDLELSRLALPIEIKYRDEEGGNLKLWRKSIFPALNWTIKEYSDDSLAIVNEENNSLVVYKKLPLAARQKQIQFQNLSDRAFAASSPFYSDTLEFFNDSTYITRVNGRGDFWTIHEFEGYHFLILGQRPLSQTLIHVDKTDDGFKFINFYTKQVQVEFRELIKQDTSGLCGDWIEYKTFYQDASRPPPPRELEISIKPDGIQFWNRKPVKWTLSPSGTIIRFQNEDNPLDPEERGWKIKKIDTQQLIVEISAFEMVETLIFRRK